MAEIMGLLLIHDSISLAYRSMVDSVEPSQVKCWEPSRAYTSAAASCGSFDNLQ